MDRLAVRLRPPGAQFTLQQKEEKLHLLQGLGAILLDIDRAIAIIRETEQDAMVVPNLMAGFQLDRAQAEYVADIRLRNINKEYILKRTAETQRLEADIADLRDLIEKPARIRKEIIRQLEGVKKKYGTPGTPRSSPWTNWWRPPRRRTTLPVAPVHLFLSREGILKDLPQSLRMSGEQKFKEGDGPPSTGRPTPGRSSSSSPTGGSATRPSSGTSTTPRPASWGTTSPPSWRWRRGEAILWACLAGDYTGHLLFFFENGKAAKVPWPATRR